MPMKNNAEYFPRLNVHILEEQAKRWVKKYPEAFIKRILLCKYAPPYEGSMVSVLKCQPSPIKYAVVFEIDLDDKTIGMTAEEHADYDLKDIKRERPQEPYEPLLAATKPNRRISDNERFHDLITQDFEDVYKEAPKANYHKEWDFQLKFNNYPLNANVRTDEPCRVLYSATDKDNMSDKVGSKSENPNHISNRHQQARERCREVATRLLGKNPNINISEAIDHSEMVEASKRENGNCYLEKTVRSWINDLWPDEARRPGRPRK